MKKIAYFHVFAEPGELHFSGRRMLEISGATLEKHNGGFRIFIKDAVPYTGSAVAISMILPGNEEFFTIPVQALWNQQTFADLIRSHAEDDFELRSFDKFLTQYPEASRV